jgi:hypothetical protein
VHAARARASNREMKTTVDADIQMHTHIRENITCTCANAHVCTHTCIRCLHAYVHTHSTEELCQDATPQKEGRSDRNKADWLAAAAGFAAWAIAGSGRR